MILPPDGFEGWKAYTVGDDIAWIKPGPDGSSARHQPRVRLLRRRSGHVLRLQPDGDGDDEARQLHLHQRRADGRRRRLVGGHGPCSEHGIDWKGNDWTPESGTPGAHPNARFTAPASQCPTIDPAWEDPAGVPISAFLFGGRLSKTFPLVYEACDWNHGVFMAATMGSEATAAAIGQAAIRRDPFAMLPFIGYHMGDYWAHWIKTGTRNDLKLPKIFRVNWFRKDENGKFIWPGYGQNMRVLKWIVDRVRGRAGAVESPFGLMPTLRGHHLGRARLLQG